MQNKIGSYASRLSIVIALTACTPVCFGALSAADDLQQGGTLLKQQTGGDSKESDDAGAIRNAGEITLRQLGGSQPKASHGAANKATNVGTIIVEQGGDQSNEAAAGENRGSRMLKYGGDQP